MLENKLDKLEAIKVIKTLTYNNAMDKKKAARKAGRSNFVSTLSLSSRPTANNASFKYSLTWKLSPEISEIIFSVREVANRLGVFDSLKADGPDGVFSCPLEEFSQEMPLSFCVFFNRLCTQPEYRWNGKTLM